MGKKLKEELLPVGSVVLLEGGNRKVIIMGVLAFDGEKPDKMYDYLGVPYPGGYMGEGTSVLFMHRQITEVVFRGYEDEERQNFLELIQTIQDAAEQVINA